MLTPTDVRQLLETHILSDGNCAFRTTDGHYYEGYYDVDATEDVIHFISGGPLGGWKQDFPFSALDLTTLTPPLMEEPQI